MRSTNIIIHGVSEDDEKGKEKDEGFIKSFLEIIGSDATPESTARLGKFDGGKNRPLKLKFRTENEKHEIMSRLTNLKHAEDKFRRISITDDYTFEERQEIKKWADRAKEQNRIEKGNVVWRVRGSPKNGLRLVKFTKRSTP